MRERAHASEDASQGGCNDSERDYLCFLVLNTFLHIKYSNACIAPWCGVRGDTSNIRNVLSSQFDSRHKPSGDHFTPLRKLLRDSVNLLCGFMMCHVPLSSKAGWGGGL